MSSTLTARGLLGRKLGMTQVWDENNRVVPVTVLEASTNVVTQIRTRETDGYSAVQLGFGEIDGRKLNKPQTGHFAKAGVTPRRHVVEIRTEAVADYTVGQEISPEIFAAGDKVDVTATSKGKGFAGVMKRHGFAGLGAKPCAVERNGGRIDWGTTGLIFIVSKGVCGPCAHAFAQEQRACWYRNHHTFNGTWGDRRVGIKEKILSRSSGF